MILQKNKYYAASHRDSNGLSFGRFCGFTPKGKGIWEGSPFSRCSGLLPDHFSERFGFIPGRRMDEFEFFEIPEEVWNQGESFIFKYLSAFWLK